MVDVWVLTATQGRKNKLLDRLEIIMSSKPQLSFFACILKIIKLGKISHLWSDKKDLIIKKVLSKEKSYWSCIALQRCAFGSSNIPQSQTMVGIWTWGIGSGSLSGLDNLNSFLEQMSLLLCYL